MVNYEIMIQECILSGSVCNLEFLNCFMLGHIDSVNSTLINDRVLTVFIAADPRAGLAGSTYPESREALKYKVLQVRDTQGISGQIVPGAAGGAGGGQRQGEHADCGGAPACRPAGGPRWRGSQFGTKRPADTASGEGHNHHNHHRDGNDEENKIIMVIKVF